MCDKYKFTNVLTKTNTSVVLSALHAQFRIRKETGILHSTSRQQLNKEESKPSTMANSMKEGDAQKACAEPDGETKGFYLQQTMLRVKDPRKSLDFYTRVLGMRLLADIDVPAMQFTLYFVGYCEESKIPTDKDAQAKFALSFPGALELTYNYGTDTDGEFTGYHDGNKDPKGFGHIGIYVPDVYAACERFEKLNVPFIKKADDGKLKGLAFIQDPDGYWIEILNEKLCI